MLTARTILTFVWWPCWLPRWETNCTIVHIHFTHTSDEILSIFQTPFTKRKVYTPRWAMKKNGLTLNHPFLCAVCLSSSKSSFKLSIWNIKPTIHNFNFNPMSTDYQNSYFVPVFTNNMTKYRQIKWPEE